MDIEIQFDKSTDTQVKALKPSLLGIVLLFIVDAILNRNTSWAWATKSLNPVAIRHAMMTHNWSLLYTFLNKTRYKS
jgi:ABC-type uncharacterized transport system permease subunit